MPRDVNGVYTPLRDWTADASNGVPFSPTRWDEHYEDLAEALNDLPLAEWTPRFWPAGTSPTADGVNPGGMMWEDGILYSCVEVEDGHRIWLDISSPGAAAGGDMDAETYDPQEIQGDTFDRANHTGAQAISTVTGLQAALDAKAPLASPALTGTPTAPTAAGSTSTTQIATTAFVQQEISSLISEVPEILGQLEDLATFLDENEEVLDGIAAALAAKAPLASPVLTGVPEAPTAAGGTDTTQIATTGFVMGEINDLSGAAYPNKLETIAELSAAIGDDDDFVGTMTAALAGKAASSHPHAQSDITNLTTDLAAKAPLASPALTGNPTAPTQASGNNSTRIASTGFVMGEISNLSGASYSGKLETLAALSGAVGNDASFSTTVASALSGKAALTHSHAASSITSGRLADDRMPDRLDADGQTITDWDDAITAGFYKGSNTALNSPTAAWYAGIVVRWDSNTHWQLVKSNTGSVYIRTWSGSSWGSWEPVWGPDASTAANFRAKVASKILTPVSYWDAQALVTLTDASTIAVNMSNGINFEVTLGGNRTLGNPTNAKPGQSGYIIINQDGPGGRTLAFGSNWKFAGGTPPSVDTTGNAVNVLIYNVLSTTAISAALRAGVA